MANYESYIIDEDLVGSFLSSRYDTLSPSQISMCTSNIAGSVVVVVRR